MRTPPIGVPVNAAMLANPSARPILVPISGIGEICATNAGVRLTVAPLAKPNNAANAM